MRAVVEAHGDRRVRGRDRVDRRLLIDLLVAVPFAAGDPPGSAFGRDVEFGDLVGDLRGLELRLLGQFVAEADRSEEHTSELQSLMRISYAVFCLKKNTPTRIS